MASHFVLVHTATAGVSGPLLGSDEEDIILMQYLVWDSSGSQTVTEQQYIIRPTGADLNENILSEQCREEFGLTEEQVKEGQPLETAIDSFDAILMKIVNGDPSRVVMVTESSLHLRQVVHPKAGAKEIALPSYYSCFYDLRKEFRSFYHTEDVHSIKDMMDYLTFQSDEEDDPATRLVRDMLKVFNRMTADGHRFVLPETINLRLEPGICSKNEEVDSNCVVRARGLPWQSSDQDIAKFFRGLNIAKGGVALCLSPQGRRNGEALIRFVSSEHRDMALKRHKHHIGNRYIEVYKATGDEFIDVAGGNNNEAQQFLSRGGQVIIRMRGLPYDCTAKQVIEFFDSGENPVQVVDNEDGVLFVKKPDGRATGDAFVLFATEDDSTKALAKHREIIGSRYIELFRSTTAEVQQVLNRSMDPRTYEHQQPLIAQLPQMPLLPQQVITSGTRKDCIRLRGLPYEAQVEHILEFLGENAKSIVFQGVHMVYNAQGQPSGEAFIQMDSEHSAFLAAQQRHHRYMVFGKKQRYIEVFQCSGEDMNFVLTGGIPAQRPVVSPGMLMWDGAAALQPGAHSGPLTAGGPPGPQGPHHPLHGTGGLPPPHPHGHIMPGGIPPTPIKQHDATLLIPQHLTAAHSRPPMGGQHLDLPHSSTAHGPPHPPPTLLSPMKAASVSAASTPGFPSPLIAPYDTMAGQPNMLLLSGGPPRLPITSMAGAFTPQVSLMSSSNPRRAAVAAAAAASAKGVNGNVAKTPMGPPLLPLPYSAVAAASASVAAGMRIPGKRSFEQAFPGDPSAAVGGMKRLPQVSPHFLQGLYPPTQMFPAM